jgi:hypothetical protein
MTKKGGVSSKSVQVGSCLSWIAIAREPVHTMGIEYEQYDIKASLH